MKNELKNKLIDTILNTTKITFEDHMDLRERKAEMVNKYTKIINDKLDVIFEFNSFSVTIDDHKKLIQACLTAFVDG